MTELTNEREMLRTIRHKLDQGLDSYPLSYEQSLFLQDLLLRLESTTRRATPSSECALPQEVATVVSEYVGCGIRCGTAKWTARAPEDGVKLYTAEQVEQIRREAVEADREQQQARIRHLEHERDMARADCAIWHRLVAAIGAMFDFPTTGSATWIGEAAGAARARFAGTEGALHRAKALLARQSQEPQGQVEPLAAITDKGRIVRWNPIYAQEPWASRGFILLYAAPAHPVAQPGGAS